MSDKKIIIAIVLSMVMILFGGVFFLSGNGDTTPATISSSQNAKAIVDNRDHNWGKIPYKGGNVSKTFTLKNSGIDILKLTNVKTSCHCTNAQVNIEGKESPFFGMNSVSSWIGEVSPGKEAKLTVIFDPAYHGINGLGHINRLVSVETNDLNNSQIEFSLTGTVIK